MQTDPNLPEKLIIIVLFLYAFTILFAVVKRKPVAAWCRIKLFSIEFALFSLLRLEVTLEAHFALLISTIICKYRFFFPSNVNVNRFLELKSPVSD